MAESYGKIPIVNRKDLKEGEVVELDFKTGDIVCKKYVKNGTNDIVRKINIASVKSKFTAYGKVREISRQLGNNNYLISSEVIPLL